MSEYEQKLADALAAQFGQNWFHYGAHPQTVQDYLNARDDASRAQVVVNMKNSALNHAFSVIHAGISAGIVTVAD